MYVGARMAALEEKRLMTERGGNSFYYYLSINLYFMNDTFLLLFGCTSVKHMK